MYNAEMLFWAFVLSKKLLKDQMALRVISKDKDSWLPWKALNKLPYDFIYRCQSRKWLETLCVDTSQHLKTTLV